MAGVFVRGLQVLNVRSDVDVVGRREPALRGIERGKPWRRLGGNIDFERGREGPVVADVLQEIGGQMLGLDELIEQHLAAHIGHDRASRVLVADGGDNLPGAAVRDLHPDHVRIGADLHAVLPSGLSDQIADRTHATTDEAPAARALVLAHDVMQDDISRARRLRPGERADRAVITEYGAGHTVLEPARQEIVGAHRHQVDQVVELVADLSVTPDEAEHLAEVLEIALRRINGRFEKKSAHVVRGLVEPGIELGVDRAVVLRETAELLGGPGHITREDDVVIGADRAKHVGRRQHREAELAQVKFPDDLRVQKAHDVRECRGPESRRELLGDGSAADDRPAFEHENLLTRFGEIGATGQAVVATADDDGIVLCCGHR